MEEDDFALEHHDVILARLEEAECLDLAKEYRSIPASDFYAKYTLEYSGEVHKFLEKIDYGLETLDWIK